MTYTIKQAGMYAVCGAVAKVGLSFVGPPILSAVGQGATQINLQLTMQKEDLAGTALQGALVGVTTGFLISMKKK